MNPPHLHCEHVCATECGHRWTMHSCARVPTICLWTISTCLLYRRASLEIPVGGHTMSNMALLKRDVLDEAEFRKANEARRDERTRLTGRQTELTG